MILLPLVLFMQLTSSAFSDGESIPSAYSCEGKNISPPLSIVDVPQQAKTLALIMDDPDAPKGTFVHWVVWNISPKAINWSEGQPFVDQGVNGMNKQGYFGPCPPPGAPHHYHFKLYALDTTLSLKKGATKQQLLDAMEDHILEETSLVGIYKR